MRLSPIPKDIDESFVFSHTHHIYVVVLVLVLMLLLYLYSTCNRNGYTINVVFMCEIVAFGMVLISNSFLQILAF